MPLHWQPAGPLPAATYWRRRVLVAAVAVALVLAVRSLFGDAEPDGRDVLTSGDSAVSPAPSGPMPAASPAVVGPTASVVPVAACADRDLTVTAGADAVSYRMGARPRLRLLVRNTSRVPCRRDLGQGAVELGVFSGRDRIWSSDDCAAGGPPGPMTLAPGQERLITLVWSGHRSRPGCTGEKKAAQPGTYRVVARVGALVREGSPFQLRK